jgi:hypothetical protein
MHAIKYAKILNTIGQRTIVGYSKAGVETPFELII